MPAHRAPDVYVEEITAFPPSGVEAGTGIPAFIGYTEKAPKTVANGPRFKPTKLYSFKEFEDFFGSPKAEELRVDVEADEKGMLPTKARVTPTDVSFLLSYAVKMFFNNGGGQCYVVSVGDYGDPIELSRLLDGLTAVSLEDEPTLLVIPEATALSYQDYSAITQAMLEQCKTLGDRFAIFDVWKGSEPEDTQVKTSADVTKNVIEANRAAWTGELKYGAAYYPFVRTTMPPFVREDESNVKVTVTPKGGPASEPAELGTLRDSRTAIYNFVKLTLQDQFLVLPPSGAVAGVYAATDAARGVWKAPANVALIGVLEPVVKINTASQENLNVDVTEGKSINVLRAFAGKGTLVWGARTLAGNDNEWRYVPVRRFFNMVEEAVKKATSWAVFEPNDANTWVKVRGIIENYLTDRWREGALAGAAPRDAFFVKCGLGTTMSAKDVDEGRMNVEIGLAVVRPAEFIVLQFSHKLQTS